MPKQPAYQTIKTALLANIHAGVWQVGSTIPTEVALSMQFGVSRMTVNRAIKELVGEKVLERRQGSGTFVAQTHYTHTFVEIRNIAEDIKKTGKRYHAQVISKKRLFFDELSHDVQVLFTHQTRYPSVIFEVKIVHFANDEAVQFEERWVDGQLVPDFINQDFNVINTSHYLLSQAPLQGGEYCIYSVRADTLVAQMLSINVGDPALLLSRRTLSQERIITVSKFWYAGDRYWFGGQL